MYLIAKLVSSSWKLAMTSNALPMFDALSIRQKLTSPTRLLTNSLLILLSNFDPV